MYKPALIVNFAFLACGLVLVFLLRYVRLSACSIDSS